MQWSVHYLEDDHIVFAKTQGRSAWESHRKFAEEMFELGRKKGTHRFFVDHRGLEFALSVLQIDDLPKLFKAVGAQHDDKVAILYDPAAPHSSAYVFFENVSLLSSLRFKMFSDKDAAAIWLKSEN